MKWVVSISRDYWVYLHITWKSSKIWEFWGEFWGIETFYQSNFSPATSIRLSIKGIKLLFLELKVIIIISHRSICVFHLYTPHHPLAGSLSPTFLISLFQFLSLPFSDLFSPMSLPLLSLSLCFLSFAFSLSTRLFYSFPCSSLGLFVMHLPVPPIPHIFLCLIFCSSKAISWSFFSLQFCIVLILVLIFVFKLLQYLDLSWSYIQTCWP